MPLNFLKNLAASKGSKTKCNPEELRSGVREAYSAAAREPMGKHPFPVGRKFAESIGYPAELLDSIPSIAWEAFVGVSNVSVFADIKPGATLLDIGCGSGLDSIVAAKRGGKGCRVIGVDFSSGMLARAGQAVKDAGLSKQVELFCASAEQLPLDDASIDVILVNGIFNLNPKRKEVFSEIARVLKTDGKVYAAELVFTEPVATRQSCSLDDWFA